MTFSSSSGKPDASPWGCFALVTYLPEPLGSFLTELRRRLPGESQAEAHITFLPPRDLTVPLEQAALAVRKALEPVKPFVMELGEVRLFPETRTLYLDVAAGQAEILRLHEALNQGDLLGKENFEFIPHLTLAGPLASGDFESSVQQAQQAWKNSKLTPAFEVKEVVLLWQPGSCLESDWTRISAHPLRPAASGSVAG